MEEKIKENNNNIGSSSSEKAGDIFTSSDDFYTSDGADELKELLEKSKAEQYKILGERYKKEIYTSLKKFANTEIKNYADNLKSDLDKKLEEDLNKKGEKLKEEFENKIDNSQKSVIESLAIFAAFFTFVAVNVQIFTRVTDLYSAMWFTLLLLGCLGMFAWMVHVMIIKKENCINIKFGKLNCSISGRIFLPLIFLILIFLALSFANVRLNDFNNDNILSTSEYRVSSSTK